MPLHCSQCGEPVRPGSKYFAVFSSTNGVRIEVGCAHSTPENLDEATATINSIGCASRWFIQWLTGLDCSHK